jgi:Rad3-related DNA helicase
MCAQAVKARTCSFHAKADLLAYELSKLRVWDMRDIEDLRAEDGGGGGCPFFATRQLAEGASLIFAPYNYIFDAGVREALQIDVKGAAIIIDEGPNKAV